MTGDSPVRNDRILDKHTRYLVRCKQYIDMNQRLARRPPYSLVLTNALQLYSSREKQENELPVSTVTPGVSGGLMWQLESTSGIPFSEPWRGL